MPQRNLFLIFVTCAVSYICFVRAEQNPFARYASSSYELIDELALVDVPDHQLYAGAVRGMIEVLRESGDEHSRYISRAEAEQFEADMRQQFGGIGVRIRPEGEPPRPTVIGPPEPGTPAFYSEIRGGDTIIAIDGVSTESMHMLEILRRMRGAVGEPLELTIRHQNQDDPIVVELVRATIRIDSILGDLRESDGSWDFGIDEDQRIAYVRIVHFGDKTARELDAVLARLVEEQYQALVLDLRDNAGGALQAAVLVSDMFLKPGQLIVETRDRERVVRDRYVATGRGTYLDLPIAILINQNSASASEIVAACLQDHGRAAIVGSRSFGKGTVQLVLNVGARGESRLKLTSTTYCRPSGENIHRMKGDSESDQWGVVPDLSLMVELSDEEYVAYREFRSQRDLIKTNDRETSTNSSSEDVEDDFVDQALQRAITYLSEQLKESGS